jgi:hypothetical protein
MTLEFEDVRKFLKDMTRRELVEEFNELFTLDTIVRKYTPDEILDGIDVNYVIEYLRGLDYYVKDSREDAFNELFKNDCLSDGMDIGRFRRVDCINMINEIVDREGWLHLHNLIQSYDKI